MAGAGDLADPATALQHYLQQSRESLLWKLEGLDERDLRLPRTPTGTTLLGLVKHCANVEIGYFGPTFGRPWPTPEDASFVSDEQHDDPQADWVAAVDESAADVVAFYRRVWRFADETLTRLPLDTTGEVPWWPPERRRVTLHRVALHVHDDVARHAGHADVLREGIDQAVGLVPGRDNIPPVDWPAYVARLTEIADQAGAR